jgi:hypothetical protein
MVVKREPTLMSAIHGDGRSSSIQFFLRKWQEMEVAIEARGGIQRSSYEHYFEWVIFAAKKLT